MAKKGAGLAINSVIQVVSMTTPMTTIEDEHEDGGGTNRNRRQREHCIHISSRSMMIDWLPRRRDVRLIFTKEA